MRDKHNNKIYGEGPKVTPVCWDCQKPFHNYESLTRHREKYKRKCKERYTFPHFMLCRFTYRYFSFTRQGKGKRNTSPSLIQPDSHSPPNHPLPNSSLLQSIPGNSGTSNHWWIYCQNCDFWPFGAIYRKYFWIKQKCLKVRLGPIINIFGNIIYQCLQHF